jgi:hypothetical protein
MSCEWELKDFCERELKDLIEDYEFAYTEYEKAIEKMFKDYDNNVITIEQKRHLLSELVDNEFEERDKLVKQIIAKIKECGMV